MRPIRLQIEGLTAFADPAVVDFTGLQLFAITGTTGAGKSTLIDAMLLALFGKVPRAGNEHRQLIALGKDQLNVAFEFAVGGVRYRVGRSLRRRGASQVQFERVTAAGPEPIAGGARDTEQAITRVLGIDYEAFTHAVVLPQGQFDEFLRGQPSQRREILVDLLGLGAYRRMAELCGQRERGLEAERHRLQQRLDEEFATATPAALAALQQSRTATAQERDRHEAHARAVADLLQRCHAAAAVQLEADRLAGERTAIAQHLADARAAAERAAAVEAGFAAARQRLRDELVALANAADETLRLERAVAALALLQRALAERPALERDANSRRARLQTVAAELDAAQRRLPALQASVAARAAEAQHAAAALEQQQRTHAAAELRQGLHVGAACPVCTQRVPAVPDLPAPDLQGPRQRHDDARALLEQARLQLTEAERTLARHAEDLPDLRAMADTAQERLQANTAQQDDALAALTADAVAVDRPVTAALVQQLGQRLQTERAAASAATRRRAHLQAELDGLEQQHGQAPAALAAATARAEQLAQQLAGAATAATARHEQAALQRAELERTAAAHGIDGKAASIADLLRRTTQAATAAEDSRRAADQRLGRLDAQLTALQQAIARADTLRQQVTAQAEQAALAHALAQLLRGDAFLTFVLEAAVTRLCTDASRWLLRLSQGRYSLHHQELEFSVVDHWNADRQRSVRTLSGGETFLASLALALALAEGIAGFAVQQGGAGLLECLFIDEGFGALDGDALEAAVTALETLQQENRMVGVVTHLQALAERLPARLAVENTAGRASVVRR